MQNSWAGAVRGVKMYQVVQKLKRLKPVFRKAAWESGNLCKRAEGLKSQLESIQAAIDWDPLNSELKEYEANLVRAYRTAALEEERLLKQKSQIHWLNVGDQNNKFFHKSLRAKGNKKRILAIHNEAGQVMEGQAMIDHFLEFYKSLLGTAEECVSIRGLSHMVTRTLSRSAAEGMVREVMNEEIKEAMFSIGDDKATGPDGYTSKFFKSDWNIIGGDICKAVKEFFSTGKLLKVVNATLIALLPKVDNPQQVTEFRLIALCNVVYKCISKILANRLKESLDDLVDQTQNAFIPGCRISDNILLTQELFRNYHRQIGTPRCAFKVDIKKAYDSVNWDFLMEVLQMFGFPTRMIQWIKECVTTPSYSLIINGQTHGFFKGKKGLRQGDPLSPYLFTLVMQVLSVIIKRRITEDGGFRYHARCEELGITHLCFADDLFLFSYGDPWSVQILKDSLDEFGAASGLWPNNAKSNVFFCKVVEENKMLILDILGFSEGSLPVKYLGVPLITSRLWHADCAPLIDKVKQRIEAWQNKWLSFAGRM